MFEQPETQQTGPTDDNPLEALVGEGKKFQTVEDLAKGKLEADSYINQLQAETKQYREMLAESKLKQDEKIDKILETLSSRQAPETTTPPAPVPPTSADLTLNPTKEKEVDLETMVSNLLAQREQQTSAEKNLTTVQQQMNAVYKDKSAQVIQDKANEMGTSVEALKGIAESNPKMFLKLMDVSDRQDTGSLSFTQTSVNTEANAKTDDGSVRNKNWWNAQRREKGRNWFFKPEQQQLYLNDMQALGSKF